MFSTIKHAVAAAASLLAVNPLFAQSTSEALQQITDTADRICGLVEAAGSTSTPPSVLLRAAFWTLVGHGSESPLASYFASKLNLRIRRGGGRISGSADGLL